MLSSLHIENIAVIKNLDVDFLKGFSVLTGETGAGKSMIIDSIGLIVGSKASKEMIRNGESGAMVSAMFEDLPDSTVIELQELGIVPDDEGNIYVQRNLSIEGKSVSKINGRTVPLSLHREAGSILLNIHGQHDNHALLSSSSHIHILDRYAANSELLEKYRSVYDRMCECESEIERLALDEHEKEQRIDMLEYQIADIEGADLKSGEDEELEGELKLLKNVKQLSKNVSTVYRALYKNDKGMSAVKLVEIARSSLEDISDTIPEGSDYCTRLLDIQYELEEMARSVATVLQGIGDNPEARISQIEDRLDVIRKLKRKYGSTVDEILDFLDSARSSLDSIKGSEKQIEALEKEYNALRKDALDIAYQISNNRVKYGHILAEKICKELTYLEMNKVKFRVDINVCKENGKEKLTSNGCDSVEFMINTNPGEPFRPLAKIASGGELSRIMLAIKCVLSDAEGIGTVIFDEIDTGVSGKTAQKIGIKLKELSSGPQVICITHSAQVASMADEHYKIVKEVKEGRAETIISTLDYSGRVNELARIMGGVNITEAVIKSAKELLEYKNN